MDVDGQRRYPLSVGVRDDARRFNAHLARAVHDDAPVGHVGSGEDAGVDAQKGEPPEGPHEHDVEEPVVEGGVGRDLHAAAEGQVVGDGDEQRALDVLDLEADAEFAAVKKAWREKAKTVHPDVKPGDKEAAAEFQKFQLAYEVLKAAEERREWKG